LSSVRKAQKKVEGRESDNAGAWGCGVAGCEGALRAT
jgi:hypothetical protein